MKPPFLCRLGLHRYRDMYNFHAMCSYMRLMRCSRCGKDKLDHSINNSRRFTPEYEKRAINNLLGYGNETDRRMRLHHGPAERVRWHSLNGRPFREAAEKTDEA